MPSQINPSCDNPCHHEHLNTAANEHLDSQVENFALNFFGDLVRTEINGVVSWSLPCRLDIGLPSNPRGSTEPLGCYFLRLLENGIVGMEGPNGAPGFNGSNGRVAYVSGGATIFGPQGPQGLLGNTGQQGPQGKQGPPGQSTSSSWFMGTNAKGQTAIAAATGAGYAFTTSYALITLTSPASIALPATGTYLVLYTAVLDYTNSGGATTIAASVKARNTTQGIDVPASAQSAFGSILTTTDFLSVNWAGLTTGNSGDVIALYGQCPQVSGSIYVESYWAQIIVIRVG